MPEEPTTERVRSYYEGFAQRYEKSGRFWERLLSMEPGRRWVASNAKGDVLEVFELTEEGASPTTTRR